MRYVETERTGAAFDMDGCERWTVVLADYELRVRSGYGVFDLQCYEGTDRVLWARLRMLRRSAGYRVQVEAHNESRAHSVANLLSLGM